MLAPNCIGLQKSKSAPQIGSVSKLGASVDAISFIFDHKMVQITNTFSYIFFCEQDKNKRCKMSNTACRVIQICILMTGYSQQSNRDFMLKDYIIKSKTLRIVSWPFLTVTLGEHNHSNLEMLVEIMSCCHQYCWGYILLHSLVNASFINSSIHFSKPKLFYSVCY